MFYNPQQIDLHIMTKNKSMGLYKKDVTPLLTHWSYVFVALTHRYITTTDSMLDWYGTRSYFYPSILTNHVGSLKNDRCDDVNFVVTDGTEGCFMTVFGADSNDKVDNTMTTTLRFE